jgi:hypothetical protein
MRAHPWPHGWTHLPLVRCFDAILDYTEPFWPKTDYIYPLTSTTEFKLGYLLLCTRAPLDCQRPDHKNKQLRPAQGIILWQEIGIIKRQSYRPKLSPSVLYADSEVRRWPNHARSQTTAAIWAEAPVLLSPPNEPSKSIEPAPQTTYEQRSNEHN